VRAVCFPLSTSSLSQLHLIDITLTLIFLRSMPRDATAIRLSARSPYSERSGLTLANDSKSTLSTCSCSHPLNNWWIDLGIVLVHQMIDTQAPLELKSSMLSSFSIAGAVIESIWGRWANACSRSLIGSCSSKEVWQRYYFVSFRLGPTNNDCPIPS
jgi:hypothetical protein